MVQSFGAFLSVFLLAFYIPIVFGILYFIGIGLPMLPAMAILKNQERMTFGRGLAASVVLLIACIICSFLFYLGSSHCRQDRWVAQNEGRHEGHEWPPRLNLQVFYISVHADTSSRLLRRYGTKGY
jgi:hypothetical protein